MNKAVYVMSPHVIIVTLVHVEVVHVQAKQEEEIMTPFSNAVTVKRT